MNNCFTSIELDKFAALKDIKVVFDIGAKDNVEYLELKPNATYHLFEPSPTNFEVLKQKVKEGGWKKVFLNNFGLGDKEEELTFDLKFETFEGAIKDVVLQGGPVLKIKRLDDYIEERKIKRIDFIKIDAEGFDLRIIKGNPKAIGMTKYLQYEAWDNDEEMMEFIGKDFDIEDIGYRNYFCTRKHG